MIRQNSSSPSHVPQRTQATCSSCRVACAESPRKAGPHPTLSVNIFPALKGEDFQDSGAVATFFKLIGELDDKAVPALMQNSPVQGGFRSYIAAGCSIVPLALAVMF